MDAFAIISFVFALIALGVANTARTQIAALKEEVEILKAAHQNRIE